MSDKSVGSIVGYLRLDRSAWNSEIDGAKSKAIELSKTNPKISIQTNAATAVAQLETVALAAKKLQDSQGGVVVAQTKLTAAQNAAAAASDKLAKLEQAEDATERQMATAKRDAVKTATARVAAEQALAKAMRDEEVSAIRLAAAYDTVDNENKKVTRSSKEATDQTNALVHAIVLVAPAVVPLAAVGAVGLLGLVASAGTAILAYKGVQDEINNGTELGAKYSAGVKVINDDLTMLKHTAAVGVLNGFNQGVADLHTLSVPVNQDVKLLSGQLGQIVANVGPGIVALFDRLNPAFLTFGNYLVTGSAKFSQWATSSDGVTKFIDYAKDEMPAVGHTLEDVAVAAEHIVVAGAPLGGVVLHALDDISRVVSALPTPKLTAFLALLQVNSIIKIAGGVSTLAGNIGGLKSAVTGLDAAGEASGLGKGGWLAALGPVGIAAGIAYISMSDAQQNASNSSRQLATNVAAVQAAMKQDGGAVGSATKTYVDNAAATTKAAGALKELGVTSDQLIAKVKSGSTDDTIQSWGIDPKKWAKLSSDQNASVSALLDSLGNGVKGYKDSATAVDAMSATEAEATAKTTQFGTAINGQTRYFDNATIAADALSGAIDTLAGRNVTAESAALGFLDDLEALNQGFQQNGHSLDANTVAGRSNMEAILAAASAAGQHAEAVFNQTGSVDAATAALQADEDAFRKNATAAGLTDQQINDLITTYFGVPKDITTTVTANTSQADKDLQALQQYLDQFDTKVINVLINSEGVTETFGNHRTVGSSATGGAVGLAGGGRPPGYNGAVIGPGTGTSDTAGLYRLSNGEHVLTAADVIRAGGQSQIYAWRRQLQSGGRQVTMPRSGAQYGSMPGSSSGTPSMTVSMPIYPRANQSETEIGQVAAAQLQFVAGQR